MRDTIGALTELIPELVEVTIIPSIPLTSHGRLIGDTIYVGLPEFGIELTHIQIQAAHEAMLRKVARPVTPPSPSPGAEGFAAHLDMEIAALESLSRRLVGTHLATAHRAWLERVGAHAFVSMTAHEAPRSAADLQLWLARDH